jgi:hypothetical protein
MNFCAYFSKNPTNINKFKQYHPPYWDVMIEGYRNVKFKGFDEKESDV